MVFIGNYSIFNAFSRLLISFFNRIGFGIGSLLNSDDLAYSL